MWRGVPVRAKRHRTGLRICTPKGQGPGFYDRPTGGRRKPVRQESSSLAEKAGFCSAGLTSGHRSACFLVSRQSINRCRKIPAPVAGIEMSPATDTTLRPLSSTSRTIRSPVKSTLFSNSKKLSSAHSNHPVITCLSRVRLRSNARLKSATLPTPVWVNRRHGTIRR